MRHVRSLLIGLVLCGALLGEESKIVPLGKTVSPTEDQIKGLFQLIEKKDPTPIQVVKTKEFLEKNPLPPRQLFFQRREAVDNFFEEVLGRDPSKAEMRKTMEFLVEQETIAKIRAEDSKASQNQNLTGAKLPDSVLQDNNLNAFDIATAAADAAASAGGRAPGSAGPAAETEITDAETRGAGAGRSAHSVSGAAPAAEPEVVSPVVSLPIAPAPVEPQRTLPTFKEGLERALGDRVQSGQITREEGERAMKDILANFSGRDAQEAAARPSEEFSRTTLGDGKGPSTVPNAIPKDEISLGGPTPPPVSNSSVVGTSLGSIAVAPPAAANNAAVKIPATGLVADEMSRVLTEFGKLSLAPEEKNGTSQDEKGKDRVQTAGAVLASGEGVAPRSDNTALTPAIVAKSGGTINLGAAMAESKAKVNGWLDKFVDAYLKQGKTLGLKPGDERLPASPHPYGLPKGSLSAREEAKVSFKPETNEYLSLAQAAPELPFLNSPSLPIMGWLLFGVVILRTALVMRRKSDYHDEETRKEPKIS